MAILGIISSKPVFAVVYEKVLDELCSGAPNYCNTSDKRNLSLY